MNAPVRKGFVGGQILLLAAALTAAAAAAAGSLSADVLVRVRLLTSSGACAAFAGDPGLEVACRQAGGPWLPDAGDVTFRRVGTIPSGPVVPEPLPLYTDGTKITSWRVVTLDNRRYVELTIAW